MSDQVMVATGHRPPPLGGYQERIRHRVTDLAVAVIERYEPLTVVTGMALGWDQAVAEAASKVQVPFHAIVPFQDYPSRWPLSSRTRYFQLLDRAQFVHVVVDQASMEDDNDYGKLSKPQLVSKYIHMRNDFMLDYLIDEPGFVAALWNGESGGTGSTVKKALNRKLKVVNFWRSWEKHK